MPKTVKRQITATVPRWALRKLTRAQVLMLQLLHSGLLDGFARRDATEATLWEYVATVLLWTRVAELLGAGQEEMAAQADLATTLVLRWRATGELAFGPGEYDLARHGCMAMDDLAEIVDDRTAQAAAQWGEARMEEVKSAAGREALQRTIKEFAT